VILFIRIVPSAKCFRTLRALAPRRWQAAYSH